jgi:ATP-dependent RNA helicase DeaD
MTDTNDPSSERQRFSDLGLRKELQSALDRQGYYEAMPVQASVLQSGTDRDLIVQARTGSGKTVAYGCALLQTLEAGVRKPRILMICPTRELATQVSEEISWLAADLDVSHAVIIGGANFSDQEKALRNGAAIVVGTPGRIMHHMQQRTLDVREIRSVVLDEADRLLDMGFRDDLEDILNRIPVRERTILGSATMPGDVQYLAYKHTNDPLKLLVNTASEAHVDISHRIYLLPGTERFTAFLNIMQYEEPERAIVFCSTRRETSAVYDRMKTSGFKVGLLSGEMQQTKRERTMDRFRKGSLRFLVATDVAARGLDVPNLSHVFHYRMPMDSETYVHRSGRTGRADAKGKSILMISASEAVELDKVLKRLSVNFEAYILPDQAEFEQEGRSVPSSFVVGLSGKVEQEREFAERQFPGSIVLIDRWLKSGALGGLSKETKDEVIAKPKNRWTQEVIDLRTSDRRRRKPGHR